MALYNYDSRILNRTNGDTAVSYASYCAAEKLYDSRYDETRNFTRKGQRERVYAKEILAPVEAPSWVYDRQKLWNSVEAVEKRKDSQLCREIIISLPRELTHSQKRELIRRYVREQFVSKGMVADTTLHDFSGKNAHNPHAHILLTTRKIEKDSFGKKEDSWRPKIAKDSRTKRVIVDPEFLKEERQSWQDYCNQALEQAGREERVDCRSLKDRGIDKIPAPKLGKAHSMEQREEWRGKTRAGNDWRDVKEQNETRQRLKNLEQEIEALEKEIKKERMLALFETIEAVQDRFEQNQKNNDTQKKNFVDAAETTRNVSEVQKEKPADSKEELKQDERELLRQWQEYHERERRNDQLHDDDRGWSPRH